MFDLFIFLAGYFKNLLRNLRWKKYIIFRASLVIKEWRFLLLREFFLPEFKQFGEIFLVPSGIFYRRRLLILSDKMFITIILFYNTLSKCPRRPSYFAPEIKTNIQRGNMKKIKPTGASWFSSGEQSTTFQILPRSLP